MTHSNDFDSAKWKAQRTADPKNNERPYMLAAVEKAIHIGMPRDDVTRLLGEPDSFDAATSTAVYELGVSKVGVDEEFYEIRYADGKVAAQRWGRR